MLLIIWCQLVHHPFTLRDNCVYCLSCLDQARRRICLANLFGHVQGTPFACVLGEHLQCRRFVRHASVLNRRTDVVIQQGQGQPVYAWQCIL